MQEMRMGHVLRIGDRVKRTRPWEGHMPDTLLVGDVGTVTRPEVDDGYTTVYFDRLGKKMTCYRASVKYIGMRVNPKTVQE